MTEPFDDTSWTVLLQRIGEQGVTPFIGAGISPHPKAGAIAQAWATEYRYPDIFDPTDLARVAQYLSVNVDGMWPKHLLLRRFATTPAPDFRNSYEPHRLLADVPCEMYVTTNYDSFMSDALRFCDRDPLRLTCRWNDSLAKGAAPKPPTVANPWVFHLHGADTEPQSIVLTEDDYVDFLVRSQRDPKMLPHQVVRALSHTSLLFIGYSLTDWTFRVLFRGIVCSLPNSLQQRHVAVQLPRGESEEAYLSKYFADMKVRVFWGDAKEFVTEFRQRWEAHRAQPAAY
jgi:SIR2-like domain